MANSDHPEQFIKNGDTIITILELKCFHILCTYPRSLTLGLFFL